MPQMDYQIFQLTSKLLKAEKYPWGASKIIYIDKPGRPGEIRSITIPPFMDRVIKASILSPSQSEIGRVKVPSLEGTSAWL